jgi:hypothetical protein
MDTVRNAYLPTSTSAILVDENSYNISVKGRLLFIIINFLSIKFMSIE